MSGIQPGFLGCTPTPPSRASPASPELSLDTGRILLSKKKLDTKHIHVLICTRKKRRDRSGPLSVLKVNTVVRVPGGSASIHAIRLGIGHSQKGSHFGDIERAPPSPSPIPAERTSKQTRYPRYSLCFESIARLPGEFGEQAAIRLRNSW